VILGPGFFPYATVIDFSINSDTVSVVSSIESILETMRGNPSNIRFRDLCKVCDSFFGEPRQQGSSHRVYKTPWPGDPRVNIQNKKGKAKQSKAKQSKALSGKAGAQGSRQIG